MYVMEVVRNGKGYRWNKIGQRLRFVEVRIFTLFSLVLYMFKFFQKIKFNNTSSIYEI